MFENEPRFGPTASKWLFGRSKPSAEPAHLPTQMYLREANKHWPDFRKCNKLEDLNWQMKRASGNPPRICSAASATSFIASSNI